MSCPVTVRLPVVWRPGPPVRTSAVIACPEADAPMLVCLGPCGVWRSVFLSILIASAAVTCTSDDGRPKGWGPGAMVAAALGRGASPDGVVVEASLGL